MKTSPLQCVVDASVGIKLFVVEDLSEKKHALFAHLAAEPPAQLYVPDLFFIECTNILWKYVRRFDYPADKASKNLMNLEKLALQRIPTSDLMVGALDIAVSHTISAYDACYVALAQRLNVPLVTADEKLINTLANSIYTVRWLGDFPIPSKNDK
ncbi:MAG: twitching motility protein PilT [Candidatus Parabeggiatoa sp. nov. 2]|nr:MAG: twitching motility protein PilT [Gammaproteobacteria bacterium]HEC85074.1 PIN domain-containing protein [Thioploca sp.]